MLLKLHALQVSECAIGDAHLLPCVLNEKVKCLSPSHSSTFFLLNWIIFFSDTALSNINFLMNKCFLSFVQQTFI